MLVGHYQIENPTIIISHIKRTLANSDQGRSLTGVNTPLTAKAGAIGIRVVPGANHQCGVGNCSPNTGIKEVNPFNCVLLDLIPGTTLSLFFNVLRVLFRIGSPSRKLSARLQRRPSSNTRQYQSLKKSLWARGWWLPVLAWRLVPSGISERTSEAKPLLNRQLQAFRTVQNWLKPLHHL